ncbi:MAG TPA: energy transducer TonB [Allosphingosinicella sp.]|nr:energy transducer TonB [Allosphingosinicella sp.]
MSNSRIAAIVIVAILHALLGYAFVTGLAYNVVKKVATDLKTFNVTEPPPPEQKPPPPPPPSPNTPPPPQIVAPPAIIRTNVAPIQIQTAPVAPPPRITLTAPPAPPPAPPAPPPPPRIEPARAKANLQGLISSEDYPPSAQRDNVTGTVRVRLQIGTNGRVSGCSVVGSSGSAALDSATCRLLTSRARFTPAHDSSGNAVADTYMAPPIRWQLTD